MKITVKTLQQKVFHIDTEGTETIGDLKQKISESQGHSIESQKIIYSGKVLPDNKTVESCEIKEKDFLVLMVSKPKATPGASSSTSTAVPTPAPAPVLDQPTPASAPVAPPAPATPAQAPAPAVSAAPATAPVSQPDTSFVTGDALNTTVQNMLEMGFERDQIMRALRASYNNPERAVEYLFSGIPAHLEAEFAQAAAPPPAQTQSGGAAPSTPAVIPPAQAQPVPSAGQPQNLFQLAQQQQQQQHQVGGGGGGGGDIDLAALANNPQVAHLRELIASNPQLAQPIIQQLAASNPQFAALFQQNPEALMQLLMAQGEGRESLPPGAQVISVTEEERAAIERLEALGFPRQAVLEAYFACDKNEELAANYLFEGGFDDDA